MKNTNPAISDFLFYEEFRNKCEKAVKKIFDITICDLFRTHDIPDEVEYTGFGVMNDGEDIEIRYDEGYDEDLVHRTFAFPIEWIAHIDWFGDRNEYIKKEFEVLRKKDDNEWMFPQDW